MTNSETKIQPLTELGSTCEALRAQGKKIVHCHGVFDLLHIGHIKHFEAAKKMGDILIVTLTADKYVNKGPGRPAFSENLRAEAVAALAAVDYVAINTSASAVDALSTTRPYRYVKGSDYRDRVPTSGSKMQSEIDLVRSCGGDIAFTDEPQFSSSKLINDFLSSFSPAVQDRLKEAKALLSGDEIQRFFVELENIAAVVKALKRADAIVRAVFPGVTVQPQENSSFEESIRETSDHVAITLKVGVTEISVQGGGARDSFSIPLLSASTCDPELLAAAAHVLSHHPTPNAHLCAVFLAVLNQEARPGVTLAALRKVVESILK